MKLQRTLLARSQWVHKRNLEEGTLDPRSFPTLVMDPSFPTPYQWQQHHEERDTVVTLLLDNSGSMRGRPILVTALCADILGRTLERCGIRVEILGFTTAAWKGGESRKRWMAENSPENPGRLNDLLHIIYKSADTPMGRARHNIGLMLKETLLKENIDGEAILWAKQRLLARPEKRKIMMVISDGAPVDDSTLSTNPSQFLDHHLRHVIGEIERDELIELLAIGIGHNVTTYYERATMIQQVDELADVMVGELVQLFHTNLDKRAA